MAVGDDGVEKKTTPSAAATRRREEEGTSGVVDDGDDAADLDLSTAASTPTARRNLFEKVVEEDEEDVEENDEDNDSVTAAESSQEGDDDDGMMLLLKYNRLFGSLDRDEVATAAGSSSKDDVRGGGEAPFPPPLSRDCTTAAMGRLVLNSETTVASSYSASSSHPDGSNAVGDSLGGGGRGDVGTGGTVVAAGNLASAYPNTSVSLVAMGFDDGRVCVVDALTAQAVAAPEQLLQQSSTTAAPSIVAVSWDASATQLAAIDAKGACTIWNDIKYTVQLRRRQPQLDRRPPAAGTTTAAAAVAGTAGRESQRQQQQPSTNAFMGFMSALTGRGGGNSSPNRSSATSSPARPAEDATGDDSENDNDDDEGTDLQADEQSQQPEEEEPLPELVPTLTVASPSGGGGASSSSALLSTPGGPSAASPVVKLQQQRVTYPASFGRKFFNCFGYAQFLTSLFFSPLTLTRLLPALYSISSVLHGARSGVQTPAREGFVGWVRGRSAGPDETRDAVLEENRLRSVPSRKRRYRVCRLARIARGVGRRKRHPYFGFGEPCPYRARRSTDGGASIVIPVFHRTAVALLGDEQSAIGCLGGLLTELART